MATRTSPSHPEVYRDSWDNIKDDFIEAWQQGDHLVIVGRTGSGKTTLALELIDLRVKLRNAYCVALGTKPKDVTLTKTGWPITTHWPPTYSERESHKVIFWPRYSKASNARKTLAPVFEGMLDDVLSEGGWTVFVDEMAYLVETLGLRANLDEYWNAARSSEVTLLAATQRPVWLARSSVTQASWIITFRVNDESDRQRMGEILGNKELIPIIGNLDRHEFMITNTYSGLSVISKL